MSPEFRLLPIALAAVLSATGSIHAAHAQSRTDEAVQELDDATPRFDIGRTDIRPGGRGLLPVRRVFTSVDSLHRDVIGQQSTQTTWELFSLVPGVLLTNYNQGTTSGKIALRAFNGEGEVNAVKLLIDGVPSNSNNGNMPFLDAVFPLELQAIHVVRGTNDARFGLHNIGGTVHLSTRRGGSETLVRTGIGSDGSNSVEVAKGVEDGPWNVNLFAGRKATDGWRDHSHSERTTLSGQWFYRDAGWTGGVTARLAEHQAEEPGYLTLADARSQPSQSYAYVASDGGHRKMGQGALHLEGPLSEELRGSAVTYLNRYTDDRFVKFSAAVSQQERQTLETQIGARVTLSWRPRVEGLHGFALEGGVDTEQQDNQSLRWTTSQRVRTAPTRDQVYTLRDTGIWTQAVVEPTATLKLVPALRLDRIGGHFTNQLNRTSAPVNDYGTITQPKISAVWQGTPDMSVYANWGRTFQIGTEAAAYKIPPRVADLSPSINDGWELGIKFAPLPGLDGRLAGWQQKASDEVRRRLNDPSGDSDNIGSTRRRGIDVQLALRPASSLNAWLAMTWQEAVIVIPDPAAPATAGKEIDHVPHRIVNAGVDWTPLPDWTFTAALQGQSAYYLERTNTTGLFGAYKQLNLGASWQALPKLRVDAQVRNVTDRYSEYVWHDGTQSLHSPGMPRTWSLAVRAEF